VNYATNSFSFACLRAASDGAAQSVIAVALLVFAQGRLSPRLGSAISVHDMFCLNEAGREGFLRGKGEIFLEEVRTGPFATCQLKVCTATSVFRVNRRVYIVS